MTIAFRAICGPKFALMIVLALTPASVVFASSSTRTDIPGPAGSVTFGTTVTVLPNGNYVVTDPSYTPVSPQISNAGAVFLYNGSTNALISQMTGGIAYDMVGSGGVTVLSNGDFVVATPSWNLFLPPPVNQTLQFAGAVTKCSGTTGCPSQITAANSLTGDKGNDLVGGRGSSTSQSAVIALNNGNYVVRSYYWSLSAAVQHAGAVTFCSGTSNSCANKVVSAANSLVGSSTNDNVGGNLNDEGNSITLLSSGDYVVGSPQWSKPGGAVGAGAVTRCSGSTGCAGAVSTANSLTGSTSGDSIGGNNVQGLGGGVFPLQSNLYVVGSPFWIMPPDQGGAGAVTLCNGTTNNCAGTTVNQANSLTGGTANDHIGANINVLSGGDYVATSSDWDKPGAFADAGAVTLCRTSSNSCSGQTVSSANSLTGNRLSDRVGMGKTTVLPNGNYVVSSPTWANSPFPQARFGAATYCNATTASCTGQTPSASNSLIGGPTNDMVSGIVSTKSGITVLSNGDYVVSSASWSAGTDISQLYLGAVTLCRAATGCTGLVSTANSLVGSSLDYIGYDGVTALTNGNYVVNSSGWSNDQSNTTNGRGAATLCIDASNNCAGQIVLAANSLTGTKSGDQVARGGSTALANGNYVVSSPLWDISGSVTDVGAATFCNSAANGCAGLTVSSATSLVGSITADHVSTGLNEFDNRVTALANGNYLVGSPVWNNNANSDAGAVTLGDGAAGVTGTITASNSVRGTAAGGGSAINFAVASGGATIYVGLPNDDKVTILAKTAKAASDFDGDRKTDESVFRPTDNVWYLNRSQAGFVGYQFGAAGDLLAPADFTGDGKTDVAVFRPSAGAWFILRSEDSTFYSANFGANGDIPAPGDFDGDGKADTAVFRPSTGYWFIQQSTAGFSAVPFGATGDVPTLGDFDGDGKTDVAVFRPSTGVWYRLNSSNGSFFGAQFGQTGDKVVPADYSGDGKTDLAIYRPSNGTWYIQRSEDNSFYGQQFGAAGDLPAPGDFDGDGKTDVAVFRPGNGVWFEQRSTSGFAAVQFGAAGDKPAPNAFVY